MSIVGALPFTLANGTTADANQVDADLVFIANQVNAGALPLAGGTLTGPLVGTSIALSGNILAANINSAPRDYIAGLGMSAVGGTGAFSIGAGVAADSTNAMLMALPSVYTKNTNAWVVGAGNGGLDTGTIANGWYHAYLIERTDTAVVDVIFSLSATAPTLPTSYTLFRYIGSVFNVGGAWQAFTQNWNDFIWGAAVSGATGTIANSTPVLVTLVGCPTGIKVKVKVSVQMAVASGGVQLGAISSPDTGGQAATALNSILFLNGSTATGQGSGEAWTNTSGQIYVAATGSVSTTYTIGVVGWSDPRGQNA